jgi:hypothetical protein
MLPLSYELGFYIDDDGVFHSPRREFLEFYIISTNRRILFVFFLYSDYFSLPHLPFVFPSPILNYLF